MDRTTKVIVDCHFYFVDLKKNHCDCLTLHLRQSQYAKDLGRSIFVLNSSFVEAQEKIIQACQQRHTRGGSRVIFFLDQCGWGEVPAPLLRSISSRLHQKAEFILNFGIDWLADFADENDL
jgi:three-Cys-motif partner protein